MKKEKKGFNKYNRYIKFVKEDKYKCLICEKVYTKMGICSHIWRSHGSGVNHIGNKGTIWNKGLTKQTDKRVKKQSETYKKRLREGKIIPSFTGKKLTKEHREKISKSRIKYLKDNPNEVPYLLNHYSKGLSYPEKYWTKILNNYNVAFKPHVQVSIYNLDFLIKDINLEIDGEQHYVDERIIKSNKRRDLFLKNKGYHIIRIRWSEYKSKNKANRKEFVKQIINKLGY